MIDVAQVSPQMMHPLTYVLITPAKNEERFIEQTIQSVVNQTRLPQKWVIVDDGSTDETGRIIESYASRHEWIDLVHRSADFPRNFAAKVEAFNAGLKAVESERYDIIGSLDADITFEPDYFEFLLERFLSDSNLGVAGTPFLENGKHYDFRFSNLNHVSGACQLFRRECFEEIGGYIPIEGGGIDWSAVTTARMKGWRTRTFSSKTCNHHRKLGTGSSGRLSALLRHGKKDYYLGGHPLWQVFRSGYQMARSPYVIGGLCLLAGYCWSFLSRAPRPVPAELVKFHRAEQMSRLKNFLAQPFRGDFKKV